MTPEQLKARCIEDGDCLIWYTKDKGQDGPRVSIDGKRQYVRPLIYGKAIPKGMVLTTSCGNRLCLAHVVARSQSWISRRTMASVAVNPAYRAKMSAVKSKGSKLSDDAVRQIRASDRPAKVDAEEHGISAAYVNMIRNGQFRRDYSNPFAGLAA